MTRNNQITPGRQRMLLYLAQENDCLSVSDVFFGAKLEGIYTLHGTRKALKEMKCVKMKNVGTPLRPAYECSLIPTLSTFKKLIDVFSNSNKLDEFIKSRFCRDMIPLVVDACKQKTSPEDGAPIFFFSIDDELEFGEALSGNYPALRLILRFIDFSDHERIELIRRIKKKPIIGHVDMNAEEDVCANDGLNLDVSLGEAHGEYLDMGEEYDDNVFGGDVGLEPIHWKTLFTFLADARKIVEVIT
jgi:hypothetical protein